jgi:PKD repeat protein
MRRKTLIWVGLLLAAAVIVPLAWAQLTAYELLGQAVGSAAGTMSGGDFVLDAGLGSSPVVGAAESEDFAVGSGIWPVAPLACDAVRLVSLRSDSPVALGEAVQFTATLTGTAPYAYAWDFGGPGTGTGLDGATPIWTYGQIGAYTATLTATNGCGLVTGTLDVEVITAACKEVEIVSLRSDSPVALGEAVQFTATLTGTAPYTYTWDFGGPGNGTDLDGATPRWTYDEVGAYTAILTATNGCGLATETLNVEIITSTCEAVDIVSLRSDSPASLGEAMHFTATLGGTAPYTYTWDFGGPGSGTGTDGATPSWTYDAVGSYTATLAAANRCGEETEALAVEVQEALRVYLPLVTRQFGQ